MNRARVLNPGLCSGTEAAGRRRARTKRERRGTMRDKRWRRRLANDEQGCGGDIPGRARGLAAGRCRAPLVSGAVDRGRRRSYRGARRHGQGVQNPEPARRTDRGCPGRDRRERRLAHRAQPGVAARARGLDRGTCSMPATPSALRSTGPERPTARVYAPCSRTARARVEPRACSSPTVSAAIRRSCAGSASGFRPAASSTRATGERSASELTRKLRARSRRSFRVRWVT